MNNEEWIDGAAKTLAERMHKARCCSRAAIGVVSHDGATVVRTLSLEGGPIPADRLFAAGCATGVFTGLLLAHAHVRAKIHLDDELGAALGPAWRLVGSNGVAVTFRHLATHTGGIGHGIAPDDVSNIDGERLAAKLRSWVARHEVGMYYSYSSAGVMLLASALSKHLGSSFQELICNTLCARLGMPDTICWDGVASARIEPGHNLRGELICESRQRTRGLMVVSSTRDVAAMLHAFIDPSSPLRDEVRVVLRERVPTLMTNVLSAIGWSIRQSAYGDVFIAQGSSCGHRLMLAFSPAQGAGVFVVSNAATPLTADDLVINRFDPGFPILPHDSAILSQFGMPSGQTSEVALERRGSLIGKYQLTPLVMIEILDAAGELEIRVTGQGPARLLEDGTGRLVAYGGESIVADEIFVDMTESGAVRGLTLQTAGRRTSARRVDALVDNLWWGDDTWPVDESIVSEWEGSYEGGGKVLNLAWSNGEMCASWGTGQRLPLLATGSREVLRLASHYHDGVLRRCGDGCLEWRMDGQRRTVRRIVSRVEA
jgi:CubicO group peptidase (beta-lactamase class C family)